MTKLLCEYKNTAFFATGTFLSLSLMSTLMGMPFFGLFMTSLITAILVLMVLHVQSTGFPEYDPVHFRIGNAAVVAMCVCVVLLVYSGMRTSSSLDTVLGGKAAGMPSVILAVAQQALDKLPSASLVSMQATLGLLMAVAAFCGVVAVGNYFGFTRFAALCTASVCCLCTLLTVGIDQQSYSYPSTCELAQQAYADTKTLEGRDMEAISRLGCHMASAYEVQVQERVAIVKNPDQSH
jgi:hypothetical protein